MTSKVVVVVVVVVVRVVVIVVLVCLDIARRLLFPTEQNVSESGSVSVIR
jgi:hypothetical protein